MKHQSMEDYANDHPELRRYLGDLTDRMYVAQRELFWTRIVAGIYGMIVVWMMVDKFAGT